MLSSMWRSKMLRAIGCLSYLGLLGVIFGLVAYVAFSQFVRRGVTPTPDVSGMAEAEAQAFLQDQGLTFTITEDDERYDERVPAGHVLIQRPKAGTLVKRGSRVTIILSLGPQLLQVPDVLGNAPQAAQVALSAAGLDVGRTLSLYSSKGENGTVIDQRPAAGARAEQSASVDLFLVGGSSETWVMPDLVYRSEEDVRRFFSSRSFRIGRVSYELYPGRKPGTVLRHFPQAGYPLRRGDVIALTLVAPEPGSEKATSEKPSSEEPNISPSNLDNTP